MKPQEHDLIICLVSGHIGIVIDIIDEQWLRIRFPHGIQVVEEEDVEIFEHRRHKRCFVDTCERQE
jgi:hypothetical protein